MIINHNMAAMNTHRQLGSNNAAAANNIEKLSSGLKINKAGDDAAGLAISEKMRGQIRGLDMAAKNSQDGISLIQTAEGSLNETHDILQRMRELAVQSSNDTNTSTDRGEIQKEMDELGKEVDRISQTTQFNTKNLLDGSMGKGVNASAANVNSNTAIGNSGGGAISGTTKLSSLTDANDNNLGITVGDKINISYVKNGETVEDSITVASGDDVSKIMAKISGAATYDSGGKGMSITSSGTGSQGAINGLTISVEDKDGKVRSSATNALSSFSESKAAEDKRADGQATFQIGANTNQNISLSIENMGSQALGVKDLKVGNQGQANVAMKVLDSAIEKVSAERSKLGATQNRLEHTINNLGTSSENLTAAESRIRDVDYVLAA